MKKSINLILLICMSFLGVNLLASQQSIEKVYKPKTTMKVAVESSDYSNVDILNLEIRFVLHESEIFLKTDLLTSLPPKEKTLNLEFDNGFYSVFLKSPRQVFERTRMRYRVIKEIGNFNKFKKIHYMKNNDKTSLFYLYYFPKLE